MLTLRKSFSTEKKLGAKKNFDNGFLLRWEKMVGNVLGGRKKWKGNIRRRVVRT